LRGIVLAQILRGEALGEIIYPPDVGLHDLPVLLPERLIIPQFALE